ncbi:MAG: 3-dehydroquinate synthase [Candidatus Omnitrophica bacterium]|nr:3-dehydroquinate synthase [Candidatus Omnitrophota bacterium]
MKHIHLPLGLRSYDIAVGFQGWDYLGTVVKRLHIGTDALVITNPFVKKLYGNKLTATFQAAGLAVKIFEVPDSEKSKSSAEAINLLNKIAKYDVLRQPFIVALGGGVVGDLAGFVAAVYKRGVPYIQAPTTLLAQIDSAIGGKTAIDLPVGKNLVGAYYQPRLVWSDTSTLLTLNERQMANGLAEAVKYGIISDVRLFEFIEQNYPAVLVREKNALERVVLDCSRIKANIVARDEQETQGIRTVLNFGHTMGHAIEAAMEFEGCLHGEAVAIGMRGACDMSVARKMLEPSEARRVQQLLTNIGLPQNLKGVSLKKVMSLMKHDKKFLSGQTRFVLPHAIGNVKLVEGVRFDMIERVLKKYIG